MLKFLLSGIKAGKVLCIFENLGDACMPQSSLLLLSYPVTWDFRNCRDKETGNLTSVLWCSWYLEQLNAVLNSGNVSELAKCSKGLRWIFYFGLDEIVDCSWQRFHQNPVESFPVTVFILLPFERILWHSAGLCLLKIILKFLNVKMVCDRKQKQLQYYSLDIMVSPRDLRCTETGSAPRSQEAVKFRSLIFRKSITFKYSPEYLSIFLLCCSLLTRLWK